MADYFKLKLSSEPCLHLFFARRRHSVFDKGAPV